MAGEIGAVNDKNLFGPKVQPPKKEEDKQPKPTGQVSGAYMADIGNFLNGNKAWT